MRLNLIAEAGMLVTRPEVPELQRLLKAYESAGPEDVDAAELALKNWVDKRRRRRWSCGDDCKPDCDNIDCQFRIGH